MSRFDYIAETKRPQKDSEIWNHLNCDSQWPPQAEQFNKKNSKYALMKIIYCNYYYNWGGGGGNNNINQ